MRLGVVSELFFSAAQHFCPNPIAKKPARHRGKTQHDNSTTTLIDKRD
jgi:hypothetical protein